MGCNTYQHIQNSPHACDYSAWKTLEKKQRLMLNDWFENAWKMRELPIEEHRRGLLQAWDLLRMIGFITTGTNADEDWAPALLASMEFEQIYNLILAEKKSLMRMYARRYADIWPVFPSAVLRSKGIEPSKKPTRDEVINEYSAIDGISYAPACWMQHRQEVERPLPDWQHILPAWKTAVDNLLDPSGWHETESDLRIVSNAFMSLIYFFKEGKVFFENPSLRPDIFDRTQVLSSL